MENKKNTMGERLEYLITKEGLNITSFSNKIGKVNNNTTIRTAVKGERMLGSQVLQDIKDRFPHFNLDWLITGIGEPYIKKGKRYEEKENTGKVSEKEENKYAHDDQDIPHLEITLRVTGETITQFYKRMQIIEQLVLEINEKFDKQRNPDKNEAKSS